MIVKTNILDWALEKILLQYNNKLRLHSVVYFLIRYNITKCDYKIYNKKLFVIIKFLKEWYLELYTLQKLFEIIINHKNFEYFIFIKILN